MSRMEASEKRRIIEALILSSTEPISAAKLAEIIPYCKAGQAKDLVNELNTEYAEQDRAFEIWEVAGGYQIRTRAEFSGHLQKLQKERALRLSQAALETLAIIAYRQPATRAEIEEVRGVDAGATVKSRAVSVGKAHCFVKRTSRATGNSGSTARCSAICRSSMNKGGKSGSGR